MSNVEYGSKIGVFSEDGKYRLDIGTDAMKKNVPASHDSWATRFVLKRLDGANSGAVSDTHLVGIYSEDGRYRLDIGSDAVKKSVPASHDSWATRLLIRRLNGESSGVVSYGDVVGIFSEDGKWRLDIGTDAMKKSVPASHNSWATRLRIQDADPVTDVEISSIVYDIDHATILSSGPAELYRQRLENKSSVQQSSTISGSASVTETTGWSDTLGIMIGAKTTFKTGVPLLAEAEVELSMEMTNTFTWNGSESKTKTWGFESPVVVPPYSVVVGLVAATVSTIAVPYTLKGTIVHRSGARVPCDIKGVYTGTNSHDLTVTFMQQDSRTAAMSTSVSAISATAIA